MQIDDKKKWHVLYTKPRCEKKVHTLMLARGIESYCPLNKTKRQWSDRVKKVDIPLFTSYTFVCISEAEKAKVKLIPGVVNFVYWLGKPAIVKDAEIEKIRSFTEKHENISLIAADYKVGNVLNIDNPALGKLEGIITAVSKNKLELTIKSLNIKLKVNTK
jgi:transcription antitermination factor NusG